MEILIIPAVITYIVLMSFGVKSTWKFAANNILAGSSEIVLPLILFVLMILVAGPIVGIVNIVKLLVARHKNRLATGDITNHSD